MRELGQLLREKRVELGIDLDQVQAKTKIRKRYLMALEAGEWDSLPGEVYARGFVRSYAELLGLDGFELLQKYAPHPGSQPMEVDSRRGADATKSSQQVAPPAHQEAAKRVETRPQPQSGTTGWRGPERARRSTLPSKRMGKGSVSFGGIGQFAVVAGILVVLGGGWYYVNHSGNKPTGDTTGGSNTVTTIGNQTAHNPGGNTTANSASVGSGSNTTNLPSANTPATTVTTGLFQNGTQAYIVHTSGTMNVQLTAGASNCWIRVIADNAPVDPSDTLLPGQSKTWPATQSMLLRVGKVEVVTLIVNGVPMTLPSVSGAIDIQITKSLS